VRSRSPAGTLSLLRQGLTLGVDYGTRSLSALLAVAETVEEAVYEPGSLRQVPGGVAFALENPPLRVGAFVGLRVLVDGVPIAPDAVRMRKGVGTPWQSAAGVTVGSPFEWGPGERTEFEVPAPTVPAGRRVFVRIELRSLAIPPLVWCELREVPTPGDSTGP
jgi:hypothetical protein